MQLTAMMMVMITSLRWIRHARGGGGHSHMEQMGMLVGNFEFNP